MARCFPASTVSTVREPGLEVSSKRNDRLENHLILYRRYESSNCCFSIFMLAFGGVMAQHLFESFKIMKPQQKIGWCWSWWANELLRWPNFPYEKTSRGLRLVGGWAPTRYLAKYYIHWKSRFNSAKTIGPSLKRFYFHLDGNSNGYIPPWCLVILMPPKQVGTLFF